MEALLGTWRAVTEDGSGAPEVASAEREVGCLADLPQPPTVMETSPGGEQAAHQLRGSASHTTAQAVTQMSHLGTRRRSHHRAREPAEMVECWPGMHAALS